MSERFGNYKLDPSKQRIWIHAVSVGEVNAASPLIKAIKERYPAFEIIVSTMTLTGAEQVERRFGDSVVHRFIIFDLPIFIERAISNANPKLMIIMETEIWPNLINVFTRTSIPLVFINMRLSARSLKGYKKIVKLIAPELAKVPMLGIQTANDAERVISIGAREKNIVITGNIKYQADFNPLDKEKGLLIRQQFTDKKLIWVAASVHPVEIDVVLEAHKIILEKNPDALLIVVPRHPERFDSMFEAIAKRFHCRRRSNEKKALTAQSYHQTQVYLADTMGELMQMYFAADIAFVGGSLIKFGGQNIIEPWLVNVPTISGPHMFNFSEIHQQALTQNAQLLVHNDHELAQAVLNLANDKAAGLTLVVNANQLLKQNQSALNKSIKIVEKAIASSS